MFGIIVNPTSGKGGNEALLDEAEKLLQERGLAFRLYRTEYAGDGASKTRQALSEGCTSILCVGGDGTLSEVVGEMAHSGATLYIMPCGTGNDFARAFGLPKAPIQALCAQLDGEQTLVDCGSINGRAFLNVSGTGFDVEVLRETDALKALYPGEKAYRKAVSKALCHYCSLEAELTLDGGRRLRERVTIAEIANGQYIGGGMRVAPHAVLDDGLFDVVLVRSVPRVFIPLLLPLFIFGLHVRLPIARELRARRVTLRAPGMVVNIDGRLEAMDEAEYAICPKALVMMRPKQGVRAQQAAVAEAS